MSTKCGTISNKNIMPGWACCKCREKTGSATYNGDARDACKICGHARCDNPEVKRIATEEPGGILIVSVKTNKSGMN